MTCPRTKPRALGVLLAPLLWALGCTSHLPVEGLYRLSADEVFVDGCALSGGPGPLVRGQIRRAGDLIMMPLEFHAIELRGYHLSRSEHFSLDGTASQVLTEVNGQSCLVDWVGVHLEGDPDSPVAFSGAIHVEYQSEALEACRCVLEARYTGDLE